jgi:hypothetical protein
VQEKIDFFFAEPFAVSMETHLLDGKGRASVLYLLRKELVECAGYNPSDHSEQAVAAEGAKRLLFATVALCFTVADLLAKLLRPDLSKQVGKRLFAVLESPSVYGLAKDDAIVLSGVRNSMIHQFSLPAPSELKDDTGRPVATVTSLSLVQTLKRGVGGVETISPKVVMGSGDVVVHVSGLLAATLLAIETYQRALNAVPDTDALRDNFNKSFDALATLGMSV